MMHISTSGEGVEDRLEAPWLRFVECGFIIEAIFFLRKQGSEEMKRRLQHHRLNKDSTEDRHLLHQN